MRRLLFWAGLPAVAVLIIAAAFHPRLRAGITGAFRPFLQAKTSAANAAASSLTSAERAQLAESQRVGQNLRAQLAGCQEAMRENRELRAYYRLKPAPNWRVKAAPVIARDPVSWNRRFRIGLGSADGIHQGAAVLAGDHLIGRVADVTPHTALVLTLADTACRVSVIIPAAGNAVGVLHGRVDQKWQEPPVCLVTFLPRDAAYAAKADIQTSGLGGTMPAGLPVGKIMRWEDGQAAHLASMAYAEVLVAPDADFGLSRFVGIVVPATPDALPPPEGE
jgi:rod shape-determining protein MreC